MLRFTIRDLLWLTVVVAFAILWWSEYQQRLRENAETRAVFSPVKSAQEQARLQAEALRALSPERLKAYRDRVEQIMAKSRKDRNASDR